MYAGNIDSGIILEHVFEPLSIRSLRDIINFFIDGASKFAVKAHEIDEFARIHEAIDDPDNEFERAQIHAYQLLNFGSLHLDRHCFACRGQDGFVDLSKRSSCRGFLLQHTEDSLDRLPKFRLEHGNNMAKWF